MSSYSRMKQLRALYNQTPGGSLEGQVSTVVSDGDLRRAWLRERVAAAYSEGSGESGGLKSDGADVKFDCTLGRYQQVEGYKAELVKGSSRDVTAQGLAMAWEIDEFINEYTDASGVSLLDADKSVDSCVRVIDHWLATHKAELL